MSPDELAAHKKAQRQAQAAAKRAAYLTATRGGVTGIDDLLPPTEEKEITQ